jgi:DNA gyrase/topoisomerase IV subunit B
MFEMGMIQIAKAPLFEVITDKGTVYCESENELEKLKNNKQVKIKEIMRNKGLGEMSQEAFKHVLNRKEFTKISVKDMKGSKNMLETCFGKESQLRKDLLIDSEEIDVDLTNIIAGAKAAKKKAAKERAASERRH